MSLLFYVLVNVPFVWWLFYLISYLLWFVSNNFFIKYRYFLNDILRLQCFLKRTFSTFMFKHLTNTYQLFGKIQKYKKKKTSLKKFQKLQQSGSFYCVMLLRTNIISSITGQLFLSWLLSVSFSFRFKCYIWKMNAMFEHSTEIPLVLFCFLNFFNVFKY